MQANVAYAIWVCKELTGTIRNLVTKQNQAVELVDDLTFQLLSLSLSQQDTIIEKWQENNLY